MESFRILESSVKRRAEVESAGFLCVRLVLRCIFWLCSVGGGVQVECVDDLKCVRSVFGI